jgi:hypothetical protein
MMTGPFQIGFTTLNQEIVCDFFSGTRDTPLLAERDAPAHWSSAVRDRARAVSPLV